MFNTKKLIALLTAMLMATPILGQNDENESQGSVIRTLTPSKLISKGQFDIKWFNNLYTQTRSADGNGDVTKNELRATFFTSTVEGYTGVSDSRRVNVGLIVEIRSNVVNGRDALDVFKFDGERGTARSGITSIAPSVKFVPIQFVGNLSVQSSFFIPLVKEETSSDGVFLDQKGYTWQNRVFYDHTFSNGDWQVFAEMNSELNFGNEDESFANNSMRLTPGLFVSYFPSNNFTVLALVQHSELLNLGNDFSQNYTAIGGGAKYQLTRTLNLEVLYTHFVRGNNSGLGQTFNLGLRAVL